MVTNVSVLHVQVVNGPVPYATDVEVESSPIWASAYSVKLTSSFVEPGTSCRVYGCYQKNTGDQSSNSHFPIQNDTCQYLAAGKMTRLIYTVYPVHFIIRLDISI